MTARSLVRPVGIVVLVAACLWAVTGLVGDIDWSEVGDAMGRLDPWHLCILLALLLVRQTLNASPLALFIRGLGVRHAVMNDQAAILTSTIAPPPADIVLRVAMFASWDVSYSRGIAGAAMNTLTFYVIRFGSPALGVLILLPDRFAGAYVAWAACSAVLAIGILVLLWLVVRDERLAGSVGGWLGRVARRVRRSVDPAAWADTARAFRGHAVDRIGRQLPLSLAALTAMVLVDGAMLVLTIRFVGIPAEALPAHEILAAYLLAYPLTLFPLSGIGILDAVVVAALTEVGGQSLEADLVAGLIAWRAVTLLTPLLLGAGAIAAWRHGEGARETQGEDTTAELG